MLAAIGLAAMLGSPAGAFNDPATAYLIVPAFATILVVGGPLGEELGWQPETASGVVDGASRTR